MNSIKLRNTKLTNTQLCEAAKEIRALNLVSIHAARSGHPGGTLSIIDLAAVLYLDEAKIDPEKPKWEERDRIIFSAGHKAPAVYACMAKAGFFPYEDVVTLRKLGSPFQGHPHAECLPGIEVSSGSLGQGLSIAVGIAIVGKKEKKDYRVYCLMGDGEQQEGSVWEAAMCAAHYKLDNLCAIIDVNRLQIDGWVNDVMNVGSLKNKYEAFGWNVIEIDGHDIPQIREAYAKARSCKEKPSMVLANTIKGKGVSFMENIADFEKDHPEREKRVISVGIAEQNMMTVAAGLALEGKIPITGTYGVFASGRPWDQIRTTICYDNLNVKIAGAHGGISVGMDGATHQALEEISLMSILPNMNLVVPCDSIETERLCKMTILDIHGPVYLRFGREATPVITNSDTPLVFGKANIIRFRGAEQNFIDSFETKLSDSYVNEMEDISLIACGAMVAVAMRAEWILKEEYNLETRIINIHTLKPLDKKTIIRATKETGTIITCEEHQIGGLSNLVASAICSSQKLKKKCSFDAVGIKDRFGESGGPWELMKKLEITAEYIVEKVKAILKQ